MIDWCDPDDTGDLAYVSAAAAYEVTDDERKYLRGLPYWLYLKSAHWDVTRRRALLRAGFQCQMCEGDGALHVHHLTYRNRGREHEHDLVALCPRCHNWMHADVDRFLVAQSVEFSHFCRMWRSQDRDSIIAWWTAFLRECKQLA
jgi:hypothetical protein